MLRPSRSPSANIAAPAQVHIRRSYSDWRQGQLHVTAAYPSGGGFDEHPPVVCIHGAGSSGRAFHPLLPELGKDRCVYAPDLPGHGQSEPMSQEMSVSNCAIVVGDLIDRLRLPEVDLIGEEFGSLLALELAISRPDQVRKVVLARVQTSAPDTQMPDGTAAEEIAGGDFDALRIEWEKLQETARQHDSPQALLEHFADKVNARRASHRAQRAAMGYPAIARLNMVRQPILVLRPQEQWTQDDISAEEALRLAAILNVPAAAPLLFGACSQRLMRLLQDFLVRDPGARRLAV